MKMNNQGMEEENELRRMLPGYMFLIPILLQGYLMHPTYEKSNIVKLARFLLMPVAIYLALSRINLRFFYPLDVFFHWNFVCISFPTFHAVCLAIQFGLFNGSVFIPDHQLIQSGIYRGDAKKKEKQKENSFLKPNPSFLERIKFTIWLFFSPRGLETSWAPPLHVVPRGPNLTLEKFFLFTLFKTILCHFISTILWSIAVEYSNHPNKSFGFLSDHIPFLKFLIKFKKFDYLVSASFGGAAWFSIDTLGGIITLLELLIYKFGPYVLPKDLSPEKFDSTLYPPLFNDIVRRESLIAFWSQGWHAIFRRNIVFCGWNPMEILFSIFGKEVGKMAGMLGAMIFSGIFHEYVVAAPSKIDPSFSTLKMFTICGLGMIAEVQFKRKTGRLVQGIPGRMWLGFVLALYGKAMTESWIERGLGRSGMPSLKDWTWQRYMIPFSGLIPERWISSMIST